MPMGTSFRFGMTDVENFTELAQRWQKLPFPSGSSDQAIEKIKVDLAAVDTFVAGPIVTYLTTGKWHDLDSADLRELQRIQTELDRVSPRDSDGQACVAEYRIYRDLLESVCLAYLQIPQS